MEDLGGVALEGVTIRHGRPHRVLEFLVATGNAGAPLQLVGPERRGQQVGQALVPHGGQLQVLEEGGRVPGLNPRTAGIFFAKSPTGCLPSCVQTPGSASPAPAGC